MGIMEDPEGESFPWTPKSFAESLGDSFISKDGTVGLEALKGKTLGIYFSAHWCPPCKAFTPELVKTYEKVKAAGKDFEIVFASSDRDQKSFDEYYAEMPWLSLPYANRDAKEALSKKFKVQGIPALVIIDSDGNVISTDGRSAVTEDPEGENFPWVPPTFAEAIGDTFIRNDGTEVKYADLAGKTLAIYFSAHWCPPCRGFTPEL